MIQNWVRTNYKYYKINVVWHETEIFLLKKAVRNFGNRTNTETSTKKVATYVRQAFFQRHSSRHVLLDFLLKPINESRCKMMSPAKRWPPDNLYSFISHCHGDEVLSLIKYPCIVRKKTLVMSPDKQSPRVLSAPPQPPQSTTRTGHSSRWR